MYNNPDLFLNEQLFFRSFSALNASARQELYRYVNYLLTQQRHEEVVEKVFHDAELRSLLNHLTLCVSHPEDLSQTIAQLKNRYYELLSCIHEKYVGILLTSEPFSLAKDFGNTIFDNMQQALLSKDSSQIAFEVNEFQQVFQRLSQLAYENQ